MAPVVAALHAGYSPAMIGRVVLPCVAALLAVTGLQAARAESPASGLFELLASGEATAAAALQEAAAGLTVADVRARVTAGGSLTVEDSGGIAALMLAAAFNADPEVVQALVDAGADVAVRDVNGWSALMLAAAFNPNPATVQVLLHAGAPVRASGTTALTPFLYVPRHHDVLDRVQELQRRGRLPVASTHGGETALMLAAAYAANPAVVRALIAAGADVRRADGAGSTPLLYAGWFNPSAAVHRALLEAGAAVDAADHRGRTALLAAASRNPNPEVVRLLLDSGAELTARDDEGRTALMAAAHNRDAGAASLLLAAGADPHVRNARGRTPLMQAAENNPNPEVLHVLLSAGADVAERDGDFSMTPLMFAAWANESAAVVRALLNADADVHARDRDGWTALMHAAVFNIHQDSPAIVGALIAAGSELDAVDDVEGYTALMWTANHGEIPAVIHTLLDAGADPTVRGNNGATAATLMASNEPLRRTSAYRRLTDPSP